MSHMFMEGLLAMLFSRKRDFWENLVRIIDYLLNYFLYPLQDIH